MKTKGFIALLMAISMIALAQVSFAQATPKDKDDKWVLLGTRMVDYTLDHDVITFSASTEALTSLKFKVADGPINLHKCTIHFVGGETQDVSTFSTSTDGRIIDLKGNTRIIEKVTFWYDTKNSSEKKATVEVYGKKSGNIG